MREAEHNRDTAGSSDPRRGTLELICGCMFSGKTEELLRRARSAGPDRTVLFKHARDNRYSASEVVTHRHDHQPAITVTSAAEVLEHVRPDTAFVGIDEGHFFDAELPRVGRALAEKGARVVVTALDLDSWGRVFAVIQRLRAQADPVLVKLARCARCGRPADHTQRRTPIINGNMVGGPDDFEPRCVTCWSPPPEEPVD